jgi:hypothetical protein
VEEHVAGDAAEDGPRQASPPVGPNDDERLVDLMYGVIAAFLAYAGAGEAYGLDALIEKTEVVRRTPALRYVLG